MHLHIKSFVDSVHLRIWKLTLIFPLDGYSKWPKLQYLLGNTLFINTILLIMSLVMNLIAMGSNNINESIMVVLFCVIIITTTIKYITFRLNNKKLRKLIRIINKIEAMTSQSDRIEQSLIINCIQFMKRMEYFHVAVVSFAHLSLCLISALKTERWLLYPSKMPSLIDWHNNSSMFALCNIWHTIYTIYSGILIATVEYFGIHLFLILNVYLEILERRVSRIGWDWNGKDATLPEKFRVDIITSFKFHKLCTR